MGRFVWALPLLALALVGCKGQPPGGAIVNAEQRAAEGGIVELITPGGVFSVRNLRWDSNTRSASFSLDGVHPAQHGDRSRMVSVAPAVLATESDLPPGVAYHLRGDNGERLFELSIGWDADSGVSWARERTESDELVIIRRVADETVTETYIMNGERFVMRYANLPWRDIERAVAHYKRLGAEGMRSHGDLVEVMVAFEAFYTPHLSNTLHRNPDAELLAAVASSEPLAVAISLAGDDPLRPGGKFIDYMCAGFGLCAFFKCPFFGPFNTLCDICSMGSLMCLFIPFMVP